MSLSKKKRFEVFKRDGFVCQYCGQHPPAVTLEVDHVRPKSRGGEDSIHNLVTACFDCNRGKSNIELSSVPESIDSRRLAIEEKELQYTEYQKLLRKIERRINKDISVIDAIYSECYEGYVLSDKFKNTSLKSFINKLGLNDTKEAAYKAFGRIRYPNDGVKYFCGICWNKIKGE